MATFFILFLLNNPANANTNQYIVKPGDTLYRIAVGHQLTVDELKQMNRLVADQIFVGQKLVTHSRPANATTETPSQEIEQQYITITQAGKKIRVPLPKPPVANGTSKPSPSTEKLLSTVTTKALAHQGTPYLWGGVTTKGFDCSGFLYYVFKETGMDLPRMDTLSMYSNSYHVTNPVPGDLVFFENTYRSGISHAGIYLGDGKFIHAGSKAVEIASVDTKYWKEKLVGFTRFNKLK